MTLQEAIEQARESLRSGKTAEARAICNQILARIPEQPEALHLLGMVHYRENDAARAAELIGRAAALEPDRVDVLFNLASALLSLNRTDEAIGALRRAAQAPSRDARALTHLAMALHGTGQFADAEVCLRRAVAAGPDDPMVLSVSGKERMIRGEYRAALELLRRARDLAPGDADVHVHIAISLLALGEYAEGWREFEWRLRLPGNPLVRGELQAPQWSGGDLAGKTLLLHSEGGFGDTINFARYLPLLRGRAGRLIVECQPPLIPLLSSIEGIDEWIGRGQPLPRFDLQVPLVSLPFAFKTELESIPNSVPYLSMPPDRAAVWSTRFERNDSLKVGLCWSGNTYVPDDRRSIPAQELAPLARISGVRFYGLQVGGGAARPRPAGLDLLDLTPYIGDFADTAALVSQLDLVISVDTSVAHLAGALGKRVWLLLQFVPGYQWMLNRTDSPWYPTMRVFRQPQPGDWAAPIAEVAAALKTAGSRQ